MRAKPKRAELAKLAKLDEAALEAWSEAERAHVEKIFTTGRGMGMTLRTQSRQSISRIRIRDTAEHVSYQTTLGRERLPRLRPSTHVG